MKKVYVDDTLVDIDNSTEFKARKSVIYFQRNDFQGGIEVNDDQISYTEKRVLKNLIKTKDGHWILRFIFMDGKEPNMLTKITPLSAADWFIFHNYKKKEIPSELHDITGGILAAQNKSKGFI